MSPLVLTYSLAVAQMLLGVAMGCAAFRIFRGPRAQDRVSGLRHIVCECDVVAFDVRHAIGQHALF